ncbi:hypothetical protein GCM10009551_075320 [Nocardiopsis tropica]|nr:S1 family peptidase [Tsukamurella sp. TY48]GIZ97627.1 hypothetical protein TTY48_22390 [Tsukamurella sp. TY48]
MRARSALPGAIAGTITAILTAGLGAPAAQAVPAPPAPAPAVTVGPGSAISIAKKENPDGTVDASRCTLGFIAVRPDGSRVGLIAGHCGTTGQRIGVPAPGKPNTIREIGRVANSSNPPTRVNPDTGKRGPADPSAPDWAVLEFRPNVTTTAGKGAVQPRSVGIARAGDRVCQQGVTTGWRCGVVIKADARQIATDIASRQGDSGGPLIRLSDGAALGIVSSILTGDPAVARTYYWTVSDSLARAGGLTLATVGPARI